MTPEEVHDIVLQIAPELSQQRLYVVDHSVAGYSTAHAGGFAIDYLPENVFDIPDWEGPGAILALDFDGTRLAARQGKDRPCILSVAIHEVGHLVPIPSDSTRAAMEHLRDGIPAETIRCDLAAELEGPDTSDNELVMHGPLFIRRCVHLLVRALELGHEVYAADILGYRWLTPLQNYLDPLLGDAIRMRDATFAEIDKLPMPEATLELFEKDKRYYFSQKESTCAQLVENL